MISSNKMISPPKRRFTKLNESFDDIIIILLEKYIIDFSSIVKHHFLNEVIKIIDLNNFTIIIEHQET